MAENEHTVHLPFRATKILKTPHVEGVFAIAVGIDGELCRLGED